MWESRPLPKIVRDPLAAHSARGSFFVLFPLWGATARYERFLALHVILIVPGTSRGFFCFGGKVWREGEPFWKKVLPPRAPPFQKLLSVSLRKDGKSAAWPG